MIICPGFVIRPVLVEDIPFLKEIFEQGRRHQLAQGFEQWKPGYPSETLLREEAEDKKGYVIEKDGHIAGYFALYLDNDAEYDRLNTIWREKGRYGVVHRLVLGDSMRGQGLCGELFKAIENHVLSVGIPLMRIDTGLENRPMQKLMSKLGYENLGAYEFLWGPRLAFEKVL